MSAATQASNVAAAETAGSSESWRVRFDRSPWPVIIFAGVVLIAYGYEIFAFHITTDESLSAQTSQPSWALTHAGRGRWMTGLLSLALPANVAPTVAPALGVGMMALGLWLVTRRLLQLDRTYALIASSLAVTVPTFAFMVSFADIVYGIGAGYLLIVATLATGKSSRAWVWAISVLLGAAAMGVYQALILAILAGALAMAFREGTWLGLLRWVGLTIGSAVAYLAVSQLTYLVIPRLNYIENFFNPSAFFEAPWSLLRRSIRDGLNVLALNGDLFGLQSPLLLVTFVSMALLALGSVLLRASGEFRWVALISTSGILSIPFLAGVMSLGPVPLRSWVFLPLCLAALTAVGLHGLDLWPGGRVREGILVAVLVLTGFTVVAQMVIGLRLLGSSQLVYEHDQQFAYEINREIRLQIGAVPSAPLPMVPSGAWQFGEGPLTEQREATAASVFAFGREEGPDRVVSFLANQGVPVTSPTPEETSRSESLLAEMPPWPQPGWLRVEEGVVLCRLGP